MRTNSRASIALMTTLVVAGAACSNDGDSSGGNKSAAKMTEGASSQTKKVTLRITCGAVATDQKFCRSATEAWSEKTGHSVEVVVAPNSTSENLAMIQQLMASKSSDIDVFSMDVIWPGILGAHIYDLSPHFSDEYLSQFFPKIIQGMRVGDKLAAIPWFTDAGLLYYRRDLLEKYGQKVPTTWDELTATARLVMDGERAAGNDKMWGYVFQGRAYEGLTVNGLEWVGSYGGGSIVEPDGTVSINNPQAIAALELAASWVGTISPKGVLNYQEEDARGVWQSGNAVFMRNWPYAFAAGNSDDSPIQGKFAVTPLPAGPGGHSVAGLGGWSLGVTKYSKHPEIAADLVKYMTSKQEQKRRATEASYNPTIPALYEDPDVLAANPFMGELYPTFVNATPRPAAVTGSRYNRVSSLFFKAVHRVLSGEVSAASSLAELERRLNRVSKNGRRW